MDGVSARHVGAAVVVVLLRLLLVQGKSELIISPMELKEKVLGRRPVLVEAMFIDEIEEKMDVEQELKTLRSVFAFVAVAVVRLEDFVVVVSVADVAVVVIAMVKLELVSFVFNGSVGDLGGGDGSAVADGENVCKGDKRERFRG